MSAAPPPADRGTVAPDDGVAAMTDGLRRLDEHLRDEHRRHRIANLGLAPALPPRPWLLVLGSRHAGKGAALAQAGFAFNADGRAGPALRWCIAPHAVLLDVDEPATATATPAWQALLQALRERRGVPDAVLLLLAANEVAQIDPDVKTSSPAAGTAAAALGARLGELAAALAHAPPLLVALTHGERIAGWPFAPQPSTLKHLSPLSKGGPPIPAPVAPVTALSWRLDVVAAGAGFADLRSRLEGTLAPVVQRLWPRVPAPEGPGAAAALRLLGVVPPEALHLGLPYVMAVLATAQGPAALPLRALALVGGAPDATGGAAPVLSLAPLLDEHMQAVHAQALAASRDPRRLRRRLAVGYASLAGVALLGATMLAVSLDANRGYLDRVEAGVAVLEDSAPGAGATAAELAAWLDALARAADGPGAGTLLRRPLDVRASVENAVRQAYERALRTRLLPRLVERSAAELRATATAGAIGSDVEALLVSFRAYLMLHDPERFDAATVRAWLAAPGAEDREAWRRALDTHLESLLLLDPEPAPTAPDGALVDKLRRMLGRLPVETLLLDWAGRPAPPGFDLAQAAGAEAAQVFVRRSGQPLDAAVPGRFTADGQRAWQARLDERLSRLPAALAELTWLLGSEGPGPGVEALRTRLQRRYDADAIAAWDALLADLQLRRPASPADEPALLSRLGAADSPLVRLVQAIATQSAAVPGTALADHFAVWQRYTNGNPPPMDALRAALQTVQTQSAQNQAAPDPASAREALGAALRDAPPALAAWFQDLVESPGSVTADREALAALCERTIAGRYPFVADARADVVPDDFARLFAPGGAYDRFFQRHLAGRLDTTPGRPWPYDALGRLPAAATPSLKRAADAPAAAKNRVQQATPATDRLGRAELANHQRAAAIRQGFFAGGSTRPALRIELRLAPEGKMPYEVLLTAGGVTQPLRPGGPGVVSTVPSAGEPVALQLAGATAELRHTGWWALLRLLEAAPLLPSPTFEAMRTTVLVGRIPVPLQVRMPSNALVRGTLRDFGCR